MVILQKPHYLFWLLLITTAAGLLRFWQLGELQQLVFDEVYFPKYAHNYLTHTYFFDTHPPLSKYLMAAGIWLHNNLAWTADPPYHLVEIEKLSAISWRWLNAATGTILCLVVARLALLLHPSYLFSLLCALFIAIDGTFIVESRFGMNNLYLVFFGTCAILPVVRLARDKISAHTALIICGLFLGCAYSVKWNGLGFSLLIWALVFLWLMPRLKRFNERGDHTENVSNAYLPTTLRIWQYLLYLVVLPFGVYTLIWQPHLMLFDQHDFFEMQQQILGYHSNTVTSDEHPYCSKWYTWPALLRPIGYYFSADNASADSIDHLFTDIHLLGNPLLFWLSALAILWMTLLWSGQLLRHIQGKPSHDYFLLQSVLVIGFFANWLPWSLVSRCTFQYHYLPASLFAFMALAWFISQWINSGSTLKKSTGLLVLLGIVIGFIYWLPLQLGLPLHPENFYERMWFKNWI